MIYGKPPFYKRNTEQMFSDILKVFNIKRIE